MTTIAANWKRKISILEVGPLRMFLLIRAGAKIIIFQEFLGGSSQDYLTIVFFKNTYFINYSDRSLPFTVQASGLMVADAILPQPPGHYHSS